ncbi:MAG: uridylate kinase [Thermofilum sp. ex4484_15]|nr:MAG: uridylate kinase [Thermofilum sp. ex4484_15]
MKLVLKVGGHLISSEIKTIDSAYLIGLSNVIRELSSEVEKLVVVVGGGKVAREYLKVLSRINENKSILDLMGIQVTRINALLLAYCLKGLAPYEIPRNLEELSSLIAKNTVVVMGGIQPGYSTTAVAALVAENLDADLLLLATDVEGVYDADPKVNPNAKMLSKVTIKELTHVLRGYKSLPGTYKLLDLMTIEILRRSRIPTVIFKGIPPSNIIKAVREGGLGTRIVYS